MMPGAAALLMGPLPKTVEIGGRPWPINTDWRVGVKLEQLLAEALTDEEMLQRAFEIFYPRPPWELPAEGEAAMLRFFLCGRDPEQLKRRTAGAPSAQQRLVDYEADAAYIYAAFRFAYGIELTEAQMHWWVFRALFDALPDETALRRIMAIRGADVKKLKGVERTEMQKLQRAFALPQPEGQRARLSEVAEKLKRGEPL